MIQSLTQATCRVPSKSNLMLARLPIPLAVAIEWYKGLIASTTAQSLSGFTFGILYRKPKVAGVGLHHSCTSPL